MMVAIGRAVGVGLFVGVMLVCSGVAPAAAEDPVSKVIDRAAQRGNELVAQAERSGSAMATRWGNELNVAAQNALIALGGERHKVLSDLDNKQRVLVLEIERVLKAAESFQPGAFRLKDSAVLDLYRLSATTIFASGYSYLVQRIDGTTQLAGQSEYRLWVTGLGYGPDSSQSRSRLKTLLVNGRPTQFEESTSMAHVSELVVPAGALPFDARKLRTVEVTLVREVVTKGWVLWGSNEEFRTTFRMTLMPRFAGAVNVSHKRPTQVWVEVDARRRAGVWTSPDHNQSRDARWFAYNQPFRVPANLRFTPPVFYQHQGEGCGHTRNNRVELLEDGHDLHFYVEVQGSPCTFTWGGRLEELRSGDDAGESFSVDLEYGKNIVLELPPNATFWRLQGMSATLQPIDAVGEQDSGPLKYANAYESGGKKYVVYSVAPPAW